MPPKKRGPQPDPDLPPLQDRNKSAQKKYYHKTEEDKEHPQSWYVQRKRVYDRIKKTGKLPQARTITKYGIQVEGNRVVVPGDLAKPNVVVDWVPAPTKTVVIHAREPDPVIVKPVIQGTITSDVSNEYLDKNYTLGTTTDSETRKARDSWVAKYRGLGKFLKKVGVLKDIHTGDLAAALNQYEKVINYIDDMKISIGDNKGVPVGPGTRNERLKVILVHLDNNPYLKEKVSNAAYKAYREAQQSVSMAAGERTANARDEKSVYKWTEVMDAIEHKFGKYSRENMYARVYNEVPVRNELKNIPFLKSMADYNKKENYCYIKSPTDITIFINHFKTEAGVKAQAYKLSPEVCDIITKNMAARDQADKDEMRSLFPFPYDHEESLWVWFGKAIAEAGYPKYPYGKTKESGKDETQNGTRHAIASWRNANDNKLSANPEPYGSELAAKMLHTLATSERVYRNTGFLETPGTHRPPMRQPVTLPTAPPAPKRVEVVENGKTFRGTVGAKLKNGKFLIDWDDPSEPQGEYTAAEVKRFLVKK